MRTTFALAALLATATIAAPGAAWSRDAQHNATQANPSRANALNPQGKPGEKPAKPGQEFNHATPLTFAIPGTITVPEGDKPVPFLVPSARLTPPSSAAEKPLATPPSPPPPAASGSSGNACGDGDLAMLLSPACMEVMRAGRPNISMLPGGLLPQPAAPAAPSAPLPVSCSVAIYPLGPNGQPSGANPAMQSFNAPELRSCLDAATRQSYGIASISNISAIVPGYGVVGVICHRAVGMVASINCVSQPGR